MITTEQMKHAIYVERCLANDRQNVRRTTYSFETSNLVRGHSFVTKVNPDKRTTSDTPWLLHSNCPQNVRDEPDEASSIVVIQTTYRTALAYGCPPPPPEAGLKAILRFSN